MYHNPETVNECNKDEVKTVSSVSDITGKKRGSQSSFIAKLQMQSVSNFIPH